MIELDAMNIKALKASWVRSSMTTTTFRGKLFKIMARHLGGFKFLLSCNYMAKDPSVLQLPIFYLNILNFWQMIKKVLLKPNQEETCT